MWDTKYFSKDEMRCKCGCGQALMDFEFMKKLTFLRECYEKPMIVSSGYRCAKHPVEAKKAKPGAHSTGKAVDIAISGEEAYTLLKMAMQAGFIGIGVQQKGSGRFIHLDMGSAEDGLTRPTVWSY